MKRKGKKQGIFIVFRHVLGLADVCCYGRVVCSFPRSCSGAGEYLLLRPCCLSFSSIASWMFAVMPALFAPFLDRVMDVCCYGRVVCSFPRSRPVLSCTKFIKKKKRIEADYMVVEIG